MPPPPTYAHQRLLYAQHIDRLAELCRAKWPSTSDVEVSVEDNPSVLSPPFVIPPLYGCAEAVGVAGLHDGAEVELVVDGSPALSGTNPGPGDSMAFDLPTALVEGDTVWARQRLPLAGGGFTTWAKSKVETVDKWILPLPPPTVMEPVHACATGIGVRSLVGSRVEARKTPRNGSPPSTQVTVVTGPGGVSMNPGGTVPYEEGDAFTVTATLCPGQTSTSTLSEAIPAPTTLNQPQPIPSEPIEGQASVYFTRMTFGSFARVSAGLPGSTVLVGDTQGATNGTTNLLRLTSPLAIGEVIDAVPRLYCPTSPPGPPVVSPPTKPCADLPAPRISAPVIGRNTVTVLSAAPGARIRLYDALGTEIADGVGSTLMLAGTRVFVSGDFITAVQQVGTCLGRKGYRVPGIPAGGG
jgi:hypothetical protein